ncbi:MAG: NAD(+)/NADH kinase [Alphaproteobacteria bacterium]|nr:NAD(+)/NADH kinase [Alphaproteobacteria bacterium]
MIHADPRNPKAVEVATALERALGDRTLPQELVIAVGGDGWLLSTMHDLGADRVYMGVNAGRVGFLLNDLGPRGGIGHIQKALERRDWVEHRFPLIELDAVLADGRRVTAPAVNDVFVERVTGRTALLRVSVDGSIVVEQLSCDGLIVATALGSTAYSFSAGGTPSHPLVPALHVTPICAHAPRLAPFVLPLDACVHVEVIRPGSRPVRASTDGMDRGHVQSVEVRRTHREVTLAFLPGHDFTATMIAKIIKA